NFQITAADGKTYDTKHYNLSAIIAVGYKPTPSARCSFASGPRVSSRSSPSGLRAWGRSLVGTAAVAQLGGQGGSEAVVPERLEGHLGVRHREVLRRVMRPGAAAAGVALDERGGVHLAEGGPVVARAPGDMAGPAGHPDHVVVEGRVRRRPRAAG